MKKIKYLGLIMIMALMLTGCGSNGNSNGGIDNGSNKKIDYYSNAETIYFNAETGKKCDNYTEENSKYDNTSGCLKWYLYSDNGDKTVNLLLDHNISSSMGWNKEEDVKSGPSKSLLNTLKEKTSNWTGVNDRKDKYILNPSDSINYTIDYSGYKARLISKEEIMRLIEDTYSTGENNMIYFNKSTCGEKRNSGSKCEFGWLFDRTYSDCKNYGCLNNDGNWYWTSTYYDNNRAWLVDNVGHLQAIPVDKDYTGVGGSIRPVITIDKSLIK